MVNPPLKGYITELKAELWLRDRGYEVYYNGAPVGKGDMVIWNREDPPRIVDVKEYHNRNYESIKPYPGVEILWHHARYGFAWTPALEWRYSNDEDKDAE